jgi:uncharacterized phage-associated protein
MNGGSMNYMKLVKMLYFADRKSIEEYEYPITFDNFSDMPHGPVVSTTLDLIKNNCESAEIWNTYFEKNRYLIRLKDSYPKLKKLSPADVEILEQVYVENEKLTPFQIAEKSEKLPEWKDPDGSSFPISLMDLLIAMGNDESEAKRIQLQIMQSSELDFIFR